MSAESLTPAAPDLSTILGNAIPGLLAQLSRKMNIDQLKAKAGQIGDLDISKIILGSATINNLVVSGTNATLKSAEVELQNVVMSLAVKITGSIGIDTFLGSASTGFDLGSIGFSMNLNDLNVPNLNNVVMDIPTMTAPNATAAVEPVCDLDLGGASFKKMEATDTDAPADGFTMSGLGVGGATVEGIDIPKTSTAKATIEEFKLDNNINLPPVEITNMNLPNVNIPKITTGKFNIIGSASRRCVGGCVGLPGFGCISLSICGTPSFNMDIQTMIVKDIDLSAAISKLNIGSVSVPITVRGISMDDLDIESIHINKVDMQ